MGRYASETSVTSGASRAEIERTLERYGATAFMYGWEGQSAMVCFQMRGRRIKLVLPLPDRESPEFTQTPSGRRRKSPTQQQAAYEQATRQRWRALALVVKAKLEAVDTGICSFDDEFLAHIMLPDGSTVGTAIAGQLEASYAKGKMPKLLG